MTIGYMKFVIMKTDIKEIVYLINNENFENSSFIIKYYNFIEKNIFYTDNEKFRWHNLFFIIFFCILNCLLVGI